METWRKRRVGGRGGGGILSGGERGKGIGEVRNGEGRAGKNGRWRKKRRGG